MTSMRCVLKVDNLLFVFGGIPLKVYVASQILHNWVHVLYVAS